MELEIWSDVVCPWCYVGKRRLEEALAAFPHADEVEVRYRSFQLDPTAKRSAPDDPPGVAAHLAHKYGMGVAEAEQAVARVEQVAASVGIEMHQDQSRGAATLDAHRLLQAALTEGPQRQAAVKERFLRGYFTEGRRIDDPQELAALAVEAGMEADVVAGVLAGDAHAEDVRRDQREAAELGANGVPFFVADRRVGVSGAQPAEVLTQLLEQAWAQRSPTT